MDDKKEKQSRGNGNSPEIEETLKNNSKKKNPPVEGIRFTLQKSTITSWGTLNVTRNFMVAGLAHIQESTISWDQFQSTENVGR